GAIPEVARFLSATPSDTRFLLPLTSIAALGRMRGNKAASQSLVQALDLYRKNPYVQRRLVAAIAAVGHPSAIPPLPDLLRGNDRELAVFAAGAIADLPADLAMDTLVRHWEWMEARRAKVGDDVKKHYARMGDVIYKAVKALSQEQYP